MPLTAMQVRTAKSGRHADGKGLYLLVRDTGAKSWVLRVQFRGRRRDFGLGSLDLVTLSEARDKAREWRKLAKDGVDPSVETKRAQQEVPTFEKVARELHDTVKSGWKNAKHAAQWLTTLEANVFPHFGSKPVDQIEVSEIRDVLLPMWLRTPETARRIRQRIGMVLDYAHARKWRASEAPMRAAVKGFPKQPKQGHFGAIPYAELPALMRKLEAEGDTTGRLALRFVILTAARSGEVRAAPWEEINMAARQWDIPGRRMKAGEPHSVPLSEPAMDILRTLAGMFEGNQGELIFKGARGQPLSDMALTKVLRDAGLKGCTVHGMRSTFRDWVAEQTRFPGEWAEAALAHKLQNKVEAAYRRTKYLDQRRELMDAWAAFLAGQSNVIAFAERRA